MDNIKHHKVLLTTWFFGPTLQQSFTLIFLGKSFTPGEPAGCWQDSGNKLKTRTPTV